MKRTLLFVLTGLILVGSTFITILLARGYHIDFGQKVVEKTGMVLAKSSPDGAKTYLDGRLIDATNTTLSSVSPGYHKVRMVKEGYVAWEKEVEVFPELVTKLEVVLIPISPRLEPLTYTGARNPSLSNARDKIAYFAKDGEKPGIWVLPFTTQPFLNIFKTNPTILVEDQPNLAFSQGEEILWSPDDSQLLIKMNEKGYYLVTLGGREGVTIEATGSATPTFNRWDEERLKKRLSYLEKMKIPDALMETAKNSKTSWSPDEKKFYYTKVDGDYLEYRVRNLEDPIEVGGKEEYIPLRVKKDTSLTVSWYADSRHLVLVEGAPEKEGTGTVSLIEIDGSNKTEVYGGVLASSTVFPNPWGDKIIVLASFKQNTLPDLYAIGLR